MFLMDPAMQRIYELVAFVVALYFPAALLTWLVIDKFFATENGKGHVVQHRPGGRNQPRALPGRSQQ